MRWNCPHCGVALAVADEKLGAGWSFSKCYQCSGFALLRKSDINMIKVDRPPMGETIVMSDASDGTGQKPYMLSKTATQNLAEHMARIRDKPMIRPGNRRVSAQMQSQVGADGNVYASSGGTNASSSRATFQTTDTVAGATDSATPIPPRFIPKAETRGVSVGNSKPLLKPMADLIRAGEIPLPLPDMPTRTWQSRVLPIAIAIAGMSALGSGIYLYIQGKELWKKAQVGTQTPRIMEEAKTAEAKPEAKPEIQTDANQLVANKAEIVDEVRQSAMAPDRSAVLESPATAKFENSESPMPAMLVQARFNKVVLRSGPGLEYNIKGHANSEIKYTVSDWKDRWFKVLLPGNETAWIRNDMVQLFTGEKEVEAPPGVVTR